MKVEFEIDEESVPSALTGAIVAAAFFVAAPVLSPFGLVAGGLTGYFYHKTKPKDPPKDPPKEA